MRRFIYCGVKDFLSAADNVDFVGAVQSESFGHHESNAATTARDNGYETFDMEEIGCFER